MWQFGTGFGVAAKHLTSLLGSLRESDRTDAERAKLFNFDQSATRMFREAEQPN